MAIEKATGKAVHVGGELQWDVLMAPSVGPSRRHRRAARGAGERVGGTLNADGIAIRGEASRQRVGRRPWQVNVRFDDEEFDLIDRAARACGVPRTTLARILIRRGAEAIVADPPDSQQ